MAASVIKQRTIEKFIMSEFVQGNLNTKEQVSCMLILIQKKLGMSVEQASDFMRNAIGINAQTPYDESIKRTISIRSRKRPYKPNLCRRYDTAHRWTSKNRMS